MVFAQIQELTKSFGDRLLFADVSFGLDEGDKVGIIAPNGTGKSTLLSIIAGEGEADSGSVVFRDGLRVGYLPQSPAYDPQQSVLEYATPPQLGPDDAWDGPDRAASMLTSLGLRDLHEPMARLSGGEVKRAAIARVLLSEPDILLLDEPTNHLDIDMIEWLEERLRRSRATLLMVTHDRYFLDRVCNRIIELDRRQIYTYQGNYDYYLEKRAERQEMLSAEMAKVKNLLRTELDWMRRQPQARGSKAKYRIDNFYELERRRREGGPAREQNVKLAVAGTYIGSKIFEAHNVAKRFGEKVILKDWSYVFARYDKVGIVGDNGVGKSTLIKMLLGEVTPDAGRFEVGQTVKFGYYSQQGLEFDPGKRVIDAVRDIAEVVRIDDKTTLTAQQFLTHFLFTPKRQQDYIAKLSGGERRRLYLATVLMRSPNFLILDEPTNDLDIPTLAILEDYLSRFKGCLLVVSHDRYFLDRVAEHLFVMEGDGTIRDFPGDYSTYRHCLLAERAEARAAAAPPTPSPQKQKQKTPQAPRLTYKEKKEMEALEAEMPRLEAEKAELEAKMSSGTLSAAEIAEASARYQAVSQRLDEAELRALELMDRS